jgi:hypothetical protein
MMGQVTKLKHTLYPAISLSIFEEQTMSRVLAWCAIFGVIIGCKTTQQVVSVGYSGYNMVEHDPLTAFGSTLGWRYGPRVSYAHQKEFVKDYVGSAGISYIWLNSTSSRLEKKDGPAPSQLHVDANFHWIEPKLEFGRRFGTIKKIKIDVLYSVSYTQLFAGSFTPRHVNADGSLGSKAFPSDNFNTSHGRLRGNGWKMGLGVQSGYPLSPSSSIGIFLHYDVFDNTVLKEYFGNGRYSGGELVYKPRNAFSIGLRYTF